MFTARGLGRDCEQCERAGAGRAGRGRVRCAGGCRLSNSRVLVFLLSSGLCLGGPPGGPPAPGSVHYSISYEFPGVILTQLFSTLL